MRKKLPADDGRHGTFAGYCAGCDEACCRTANAAYSRNLRTRQYIAGGSLVVDALGTKRRLQALMALGWTSLQIDAALGQKRTYSAGILCGPERILLTTAQRVAEVYDRLSMRLPEDAPDARRQVISRTRSESRRKGWAPPLAWDDIDDPDETPAGWEYVAPDRAAMLVDLDERRVSVSEACRVLAISRDSLQKWCGNNDLSHVYRSLAAREALSA